MAGHWNPVQMNIQRRRRSVKNSVSRADDGVNEGKEWEEKEVKFHFPKYTFDFCRAFVIIPGNHFRRSFAGRGNGIHMLILAVTAFPSPSNTGTGARVPLLLHHRQQEGRQNSDHRTGHAVTDGRREYVSRLGCRENRITYRTAGHICAHRVK